MRNKYIIAFLHQAGILIVLFLLLWNTPASALEYTAIHYDQTNGFPGSFGYQMFQDSHGYIWICTENGLVRFNGYDFRLFTTKDGLPDNEIFDLYEDGEGRLWFAPFANSIGYIKDEKIYTKANDSLLGRIHFKIRPEGITGDRSGNMIFIEKAIVTCVSKDGKVRTTGFGPTPSKSPVSMIRLASGEIGIMYNGTTYAYDHNRFYKIADVPFIHDPYAVYLYSMLINEMGHAQALAFTKKIIASGSSFYKQENFGRKTVMVLPVPGGKVAITRSDGCFLADTADAKITDTLLYGYNVAPALIASDGSLWLGTHGNGVFRFINSPVKKLPTPFAAPILVIKAQPDGMFCVMEKGIFGRVTSDRNGNFHTKEIKQINKDDLYQVYVYLGQGKDGNWISCARSIYRYSTIGMPENAMLPFGYCKDAVKENENSLLVATGINLVRLDEEKFRVTDILVKERTTSVAVCNNTVYAGTLNGLFAGHNSGDFKQVFSSEPLLNGHIVKLCDGPGNTLWIANNKAALIAVQGDRKVAVINDKNGLQCNRISVLKASPQYIWAGTDNGLYAIENAYPYAVKRHLTIAAGLCSDQINCLDIRDGRIWVGTVSGINYFDEKDIFRQFPGPEFVINSITNGDSSIRSVEGTMTLLQKTLSVDFDIIDHITGQKPIYQYRMNNDPWIKLENSNLFFPAIPYGSFTISIRALSPNWENGNDEHQRFLYFYHPYPFYQRWWFWVICLLALVGFVSLGVILFIRRLRKKDHEKLSVQRSLLQLEQMALQSQMNPHFIFNCITAIKQYYSSGNTGKANDFVDAFAMLIRRTFEMSTETFVSLDKELDYLVQYLSVEQVRFNHTFTFSVSRQLELPESAIPVPSMLLQPVVENAVRHGVRHLTDRPGEIRIAAVQHGDRIEITITDNGIGRQKSKSFGQMFHHVMPLTSTIVNIKRMDIFNRLFEHQIIHHTEDILNEQGEVAGTRVTFSYPLSIQY